MAILYEGKCNQCGYSAGPEAYGYRTLRLDTGEFKILPHKLEHFTLQAEGFTFESAQKEMECTPKMRH